MFLNRTYQLGEKMSEEQQPQVVATARLTEEQVRLAIAEFLFKNEELREAVQDLQVIVVTNWQTTKWSDPDAMVHVTIQHSPEGDRVAGAPPEDSETTPSDGDSETESATGSSGGSSGES